MQENQLKEGNEKKKGCFNGEVEEKEMKDGKRRKEKVEKQGEERCVKRNDERKITGKEEKN